jgi:hypothetical protein
MSSAVVMSEIWHLRAIRKKALMIAACPYSNAGSSLAIRS